MVWMAIYSQQAHADLAAQCMLGVPVYDKPLVEGDPKDLPIRITAEDVQGEYPNFIEYSGDVDIQQGNQTLTADSVKLTQVNPDSADQSVKLLQQVTFTMMTHKLFSKALVLGLT